MITKWDHKYLETVLKAGKLVHNEDFVESLLVILETTEEISHSRIIEILEIVVQLLNCKKVCMDNNLMRSTI